MPLEIAGEVMRLTGHIAVEEAGDLCDWLTAAPGRAIDLADCEHMHAAALQAILAHRPKVLAAPRDAFLARWLAPLLPGPDPAGASPARPSTALADVAS